MDSTGARALLALTLTLLGACGGGSGGQASPPDPEVHGTVESGWWAGGIRTGAVVPGTRLAALYQTQAGWSRLDATVNADGTFRIPGVPQGPYWLELRDDSRAAPRFFELTVREVTLGRELAGRPAFGGGLAGFPATFDGLDPGGDSLDVYIPDAQLSAFATAPLAASGTVTFTQSFRSAPQASDPCLAVQVQPGTPPGGMPGVFRRVLRTGPCTPVVEAGQVTSATATLGVPSSSGSSPATWRTGDFEAYLGQAAPGWKATSSHVLLVTAGPPPPLALHEPLAGPFMASLRGVPLGAGTLDLSGLSWGRALPPGWREIRTAGLIVEASVQLGSLFPAGFGLAFDVTDLASSTAAVAPRVTPVRTPTVAGLDAFAPRAGVGLTPVFEWGPPDVGAPDLYSVTLFRLLDGGTGATSVSDLATFRLPGRRLALPPGLLEAGGTYVALVHALLQPGFDWHAPLRASVPSAGAPTLLAPFTP